MIRTLLLTLALSGAVTAQAGELPVLDASGRALEQYLGNGQWVVVKIWASDCSICNSEAHHYVDFHEFNKDGDAVMLGISLDGGDEAAALRFIERHELNYPNLIATLDTGAYWYSSVTGRAWVGTPTFLVYDPMGELRAQQVGAVPTALIEKFIADAETSN